MSLRCVTPKKGVGGHGCEAGQEMSLGPDMSNDGAEREAGKRRGGCGC